MHTSGLGQLRTGNGDTGATGGLVGSRGLVGGTDVAVSGIHRDSGDGGTGVAVASTHRVIDNGGIGMAVSGTHWDVGDADTNTANIKHTPTNSVRPPAIQTQPEYKSFFRASAARPGWPNSTWPSSTALLSSKDIATSFPRPDFHLGCGGHIAGVSVNTEARRRASVGGRTPGRNATNVWEQSAARAAGAWLQTLLLAKTARRRPIAPWVLEWDAPIFVLFLATLERQPRHWPVLLDRSPHPPCNLAIRALQR